MREWLYNRFRRLFGRTAISAEVSDVELQICQEGCDEHCYLDGVYMGVKKQCVEHARRWLYHNKGMIYGEVAIAADIWDEIEYYTSLRDGSRFSVINIPNGSKQPPHEGDLLIYSRDYQVTGHVAVITHVNLVEGKVTISEQNYNNHYELPHQCRQINLEHRHNGYWLEDSHLIGWKQIQQAEDYVLACQEHG